jgi:hypothetical protein
LREVTQIPGDGGAPYLVEYMVKEPADIKKLLSIPYMPMPVDRRAYDSLSGAVGDRGVVMAGLDHAGYALQRLIGSENMAYFSVDCRELLLEAIGIFAARIRGHARAVMAAGVRAPFAWVGPELLTPPLMGPRDFEDFAFDFDKPLCDDIRGGGCHVWLHCHGKVARLIDRFIEMGVDILNPLEPPKNGDVSLEDVVARFGRRIGLEGNIEMQDLLQAEPERLKGLIYDCVRAGAKSGRFILCPSSGYSEYPSPSPRYIDNLMLYLNYGSECVNSAYW